MKLKIGCGEENFSPVQFNGFRLAEVSVEVEIEDESQVDRVTAEVIERLEAIRRTQFKRAFAGWLERYQTCLNTVKGGR